MVQAGLAPMLTLELFDKDKFDSDDLLGTLVRCASSLHAENRPPTWQTWTPAPGFHGAGKLLVSFQLIHLHGESRSAANTVAVPNSPRGDARNIVVRLPHGKSKFFACTNDTRIADLKQSIAVERRAGKTPERRCAVAYY